MNSHHLQKTETKALLSFKWSDITTTQKMNGKFRKADYGF